VALALAREVLRKNVAQEWPGLKQANIIKTGDHTFCLRAEWTDVEALRAARPGMIATPGSAEKDEHGPRAVHPEDEGKHDVEAGAGGRGTPATEARQAANVSWARA
jgi:hypothetical protein